MTRLAAAVSALALLAACGQPAPEPADAPAAAVKESAEVAAGPGGCDPATAASPVAADAPERKAMLDVLRPRVEEMVGKPVEFTVSRLDVACDYARVVAEPRAKDGSDRYEPVDAFLVKMNGAWTLSHLAATEEGSPRAGEQYREKHPGAPASLLD